MERYFKTEGNIIYPSHKMLTWGPFYYHSKEKAISKIDEVLKYIIDWCDGQQPEELIKIDNGSQIVFTILARNTKNKLQKCNGIISVEDIFFEDENRDN